LKMRKLFHQLFSNAPNWVLKRKKRSQWNRNSSNTPRRLLKKPCMNSIKLPLDSTFQKSSTSSEKLHRRNVKITRIVHPAKLTVAHGVMPGPLDQCATLFRMLPVSHQQSSHVIHFHLLSNTIRFKSNSNRKRNSQNPSGASLSRKCIMEDTEENMKIDQDHHTTEVDTMRDQDHQ